MGMSDEELAKLKKDMFMDGWIHGMIDGNIKYYLRQDFNELIREAGMSYENRFDEQVYPEQLEKWE